MIFRTKKIAKVSRVAASFVSHLGFSKLSPTKCVQSCILAGNIALKKENEIMGK